MRRIVLLSLVAGLVLAVAAVFYWARRGDGTVSHRTTLVVIGIDGGERRIIESLWAQGKLPNLHRIAQAGVFETLHTAYNSSPVIWTTVATGVTPAVHGITDFVVPTPRGDVPISSEVRRVPALWNMLTRAGRKVAVLGWWGSWPAEDVNGYVVTDRALLDLERRVSPPSYLPRFLAEAQKAARQASLFAKDDEAQERDRAVAFAATELARENLDLLMVYFRSTDTVSHRAWKCWEPSAFPPMSPDEAASCRDAIPHVYEAVDEAIGHILAAAPGSSDVVVLSDHGFHAAHREEVKVFLDMNTLLEHLGYLARTGDGAIDFPRTLLYSYATPDFRRPKLIRFALAGREAGGKVRPEQETDIRRRLTAGLAGITYSSGAPVFLVRNARRREVEAGGDFVVGVSTEGATTRLLIGGKPYFGAVTGVAKISGTHTENTHGVFLAAGPDIDPKARLAGIHVHDMAPTFLYGLGLPVAQDFAGRAWTELYTPQFRRTHPLRTIRTWGTRRSQGAKASKADEKLLQELRSLGYIN
jgi:predicted AlkP superfamily phosphohydrolase/phosphomutase